jgi:hypothetical protein
MNICRRILFLAGMALLLVSRTGGQDTASFAHSQVSQQEGPNDMPGMDMSDSHRGAGNDVQAAESANDAMSGHDMHMNAHMFMTDLRPHNAADDRRAAQIVETLRGSIAQYRGYKAALADGFKIFLPNLPQPLYHFTNYGYGYMAEFHFDPARPTSLLYKKTQTGYELVGAMYTAPRNSTEEQLDARVPLSVARWHKHVNFCLPQKGVPLRKVNWKAFGFAGSIATQDACAQAGGRWFPQIFNWMVHVYPYETDSGKVWAH